MYSVRTMHVPEIIEFKRLVNLSNFAHVGAQCQINLNEAGERLVLWLVIAVQEHLQMTTAWYLVGNFVLDHAEERNISHVEPITKTLFVLHPQELRYIVDFEREARFRLAIDQSSDVLL